MFVERKYYRGLLDSNTNSFRKGAGKNIALLGPRKCGKTAIVKEHLKSARDLNTVYIDFEKISLNPENFSVEFIGNVAFHFLKKPLSEYRKFLAIEHLAKISNELKSKDASSVIKIVESELLKIKPDQRLLVESAFRFVDALSKEVNKKFLIALDNFENILDLNNFSKIKDVLSIINLESENVSYIAASSAVKESLASLKKFECYEIKNLEKTEAFKLIEEIIGNNEKIAEEIFSISNGHPLATISISKRFNEVKNVKKAFLIELLQKNNSLYNYCSDSLNFYYNRARGQTLLMAILKIVANEELRLSDIAKRVYRSAPVAKSILERLMDVDVICRKGNKFCFSDKTLGLWLKLTSHGYEFDDVPDDKILEEAMKEL